MHVWVVARLPQRLKSLFLEFFSSLQASFRGTLHSKKFQKTLILAFEANSVLSRKNGPFPALFIVQDRDIIFSIMLITHRNFYTM